MDADGVRDGSSPVDGSTTPDARVAMDADGVRDGASPTDGSPASDASVASDAASTFDGSSPVDGSTTADASVELDAAVDPDGMSPPDGSPVADVSGPLDALNDAEPRPVDGAVESDGGRRPDGSADAGVDGAVPVPAVCGDGNVQGEEACDDGNRVNTDLCTNSCETARCGDGIVQQGEACDDGDEIADDACDAECTCGRFFTPMENGGQCADLNECLTDNGGCGEPDIFVCENHDGRAPTCTCVDLEAVGPECTRCGDGVLQDEETCDDGNRIDFDGCDSLCRETSVEICLENDLVEDCDPGGTVRTGSEHVEFRENPEPVNSGRFGRSVSVHRDIAVVGTQRGDAAYAYSISENGFGVPIQLERQNPQDRDKFGGAVAVSGDRVLVGAALYNGGDPSPRGGAAYVYQKTQQGWQEAQLLQATIPGIDAEFG
jgi:cysteine-rich repeat protein